MKYRNPNQVIPQEKRKEINDKILYCIDNDLCEKFNLSNTIIMNSYTGIGGLHNLEFKNFDSFHAFTKAKQEIENAQFFTPFETFKYISDILKVNEFKSVLDLTSGIGNIFNFMPVENNCYGNEIDRKAYKVSRYLYPNANITHGDMREYNPSITFDYIIGNPPFNLDMMYLGNRMLSQMVFVKKSFDLLKTGGIMALIVPRSFLNDEFSNKKDIEFMNDNFNFICQIALDKKAFSYLGVDNFETKIIIFQKKSSVLKNRTYINEFISGSAEEIHKKYIEPLYKELEDNKNKIYLENVQKESKSDDLEFDFKVKKLLFDIKRSRHIKHKYNECMNYITLYHNQVQPTGMDYKEWKEIQITKEKVIKKLKNTLSSQHKKVSTYKNNMTKVIKRKNKEVSKQSIPFDEMKIDKDIDKWLSESKIYDTENECNILLNVPQKEVTNKFIQKKYAYANIMQGGGKTLISLHYALYKKEFNNTRNTLVVAPSIAINGTWVSNLDNYKIPYTLVKKLEDIRNIKTDDFILITFNMMCKYKKHLKKYLNSIDNKYCLLVDEADSICNLDSKRTKATLSVCKKAKFKLLLSGTMTRNNIVESFTQFKLMYGESNNFICDCKYIYQEDKETKKLVKHSNKDNFNKPFSAYRRGQKLFKDCFNPQKASVFGVGKQDQNVYNADNLKGIIEKSIITKSFEDIVGKKIYEIKQHLVEFNESEKKLYYKAIKEFHSMKYLFTSSNSPRKDRMMEIIQQINLLLNVCSEAQTYREYISKEIPAKQLKVLELINQWNNENVAVGCRTLKEVELYKKLFKENLPDRKVYVITGSVSMEGRKDIVRQLEKDKTGILLSTQQALSSSISIGFINKVLITRLAWSMSSLSQYFFRFIRYNSKEDKEVHFITYKNSLESNLLGLLISKENLNNFMKNQDEVTDVEEELGIDFNLVEMLLSKERDSEGRVNIKWGNQEFN